MLRQTTIAKMANFIRCDNNANCHPASSSACAWISDIAIAGLIAVMIDLTVEHAYQPSDTDQTSSWINKSLISSGATSLWLMIFSFCTWQWYEKCRSRYEEDGEISTGYMTAKNILTQLVSGAISFGTGIGLDAILVLILGTWLNEKKEEGNWMAIVTPIAATATKSLTRYGMYKAAPLIISKLQCCEPTSYDELKKLINKESNPTDIEANPLGSISQEDSHIEIEDIKNNDDSRRLNRI
jgi:hypothetical protein